MADLVELYKEMQEMTSSVCENECELYRESRYRCCERKYCEAARVFAKERYGLDLTETGHPELPFMGESGCTVAPHLRPICTVHACPISYSPASHLGHDPERTKAYFELRNELIAAAKAQGKEIIWPT